MPQILNELSRLLDAPRGLLTAAEVSAMESRACHAMLDLKLLVPARTARHVVCDQCYDGHVEEVTRTDRPDGKPGFFIRCPEAGWVQVAPDSLRQWKPDVSRLAALLAEAVYVGSSAEMVVRDTAWRLGETTIAGTVFTVFLVRPGSNSTWDWESDLRKRNPPESSLLILANHTGAVTNEYAATMPMHVAFRHGNGRFELDVSRIRSSLRTDIAKPAFVFRRSGHFWILAFYGETTHLKDAVGMTYLARLLSEPQRDIPAVSLLAARAGIDPRIAAGSTGEVLDEKARRAYQDRYTDLMEDLAEAEKNDDLGNIEKLQAAMDQLASQIASATGLGGRRRENTDAERARKNVSMAVTRAIEAIQAELAPLGNHLSTSISMGLTFRYAPDPSIEWLT